MKQHNKITAKYSPTTNTVRIKAKSNEITQTYLTYIFEHLKIPHNAKIVFLDKTIKGITKE